MGNMTLSCNEGENSHALINKVEKKWKTKNKSETLGMITE